MSYQENKMIRASTSILKGGYFLGSNPYTWNDKINIRFENISHITGYLEIYQKNIYC